MALESETAYLTRSARAAHGVVREQLLTMLAPLYLLRFRRDADRRREAVGDKPGQHAALHASNLGRS